MDMIATTTHDPEPTTRRGRPRKDDTPIRQLVIDDAAKEALDRFDELNRWGYGPTTDEVLEQASKAACDFIVSRFEATMARPKKLDN